MRLREATPADLPALAALERDVFGEEAYPAFFFRQAMDLWGPFFLVAEEAGRVAGYALAAPAASGSEACVLSTGVHPAFRGRGLATEVIGALLDRLGAAGITAVWLTVHPESPAVRLYRRLGFEPVGEEADYFGDGAPRLRMERGRLGGDAGRTAAARV